MRVRALLFACCWLLPLAALADEEKKEKKPTFEQKVKGLEKSEGFYTIYRKKEKALAVVPSGQVGKPFLLALSLSRGPFAGWQWDDMLVHWEVQGKKLLLVRPDVRYTSDKKNPLSDSVKRTYTESIVTSTPILIEGGGGHLIDLSDVFFADLGGLAGLFGNQRRSLARWDKVKTFPENLELGVDQVFRSGQRIRVHYSLRSLPESSDYTPRAADDRVGYFLTALKDYGKLHEAPTTFTRYVQRWRLEKVEQSLAASPPKQPIVFYVEKTVPYRFRRYVQEGILEWNKAFEKVGFVGAIVVRQQTETEFADLDPEDARYNFFRWGTSGQAFAMGPSRVDPRTGEILDADIFFDDAFVRFQSGEYQAYSPIELRRLTDPKLTRFLAAHPEWNPIRPLRGPRGAQAGKPILQFLDQAKRRGRPLCLCGYEKARQLALAGIALAGAGGKIPDVYVGQTIKETVMHEVGHTLGLRHNFKASSWRSVEEITREKPVDLLSGSVMDYNAVNFSLDQKGESRLFQMTTIGPYDYWAIEYGYKPVKADKELLVIAARGAQAGLAYATDEDSSTFDPDPLANPWDLGSDPIAYARYRLRLVQSLMPKLLERSVKKGESYAAARRAFGTLFWEYFQAGQLAAKFIGGQYVHRDHKGDPGERPPFVQVGAERQLLALQFIDEQLLGEQAFRFEPKLLNHLGPGRWSHWGSDQYDEWLPFPIHERILGVQSMTLFLLLNPFTLSRLHDDQLMLAPGAKSFGMADLFGKLDEIVWRELAERPAAPAINSVRRNLQRTHLRLLVQMALGRLWGVPEEGRTLAYHTLSRLGQRIDGLFAAKATLDAAEQAHLAETRQRIQSARQAYFQRN